MKKDYKSLIIVKHFLLIFVGFAILVFSSGCGSNTNSKSNLEIALSSSVLYESQKNVTITGTFITGVDTDQYVYCIDGDVMMVDNFKEKRYYETINNTEKYEYFIKNGVWYKRERENFDSLNQIIIIWLRLLNIDDLKYDESNDQYFLTDEGLKRYFEYAKIVDFGEIHQEVAVKLSINGTHVTKITIEYFDSMGQDCIIEFSYTNYNETTVTLPDAIDVKQRLINATSFNYDNFAVEVLIWLRADSSYQKIEIKVDHNTYMVTSNDTVVYLIKGDTKEEYRVVYQDEDDNWVESDFYDGANEIFGYIDLIRQLNSETFSHYIESTYIYNESYETISAILNSTKYNYVNDFRLEVMDDKVGMLFFDAKGVVDGQNYNFSLVLSMYQTVKIEVPET